MAALSAILVSLCNYTDIKKSLRCFFSNSKDQYYWLSASAFLALIDCAMSLNSYVG